MCKELSSFKVPPDVTEGLSVLNLQTKGGLEGNRGLLGSQLCRELHSNFP